MNKILKNILGLILFLYIVGPIAATMLAGLQTPAGLQKKPPEWISSKPFYYNYIALFDKEARKKLSIYPTALKLFALTFRNSLIVSFSTVFLCLLAGTLTSYFITRSRRRDAYSLAVLIAGSVPIMTLIIPIYILFNDLHLSGNLLGIIIANTGVHLPFAIWIFRSYLQTIPVDLEEAAKVDGCNRLQALIRVVVPIATPGIAATCAVIFLLTWNELIVPLFLSGKVDTHTLPVILAITVSDKMVNIPLLCAMAMIVSLPTLGLAAILHKYIISGLIAGAFKG